MPIKKVQSVDDFIGAPTTTANASTQDDSVVQDQAPEEPKTTTRTRRIVKDEQPADDYQPAESSDYHDAPPPTSAPASTYRENRRPSFRSGTGPSRGPRQGRYQNYGNGGQRGFRSHDRDDRGSYNNRYSESVESVPTEIVTGYLDVQPEGHGFLRPKFIPSNRDIYISQSQIRRFMLRGGDKVEGVARPPKDSERYYGLLKVEKVNDKPAEEAMKRPWFDDLTPIYPKDQIVLSTGKTPLSTRIIDLVAPIGFGQRGMIVSPPKAGKTTIMKEIAAGISKNRMVIYTSNIFAVLGLRSLFFLLKGAKEKFAHLQQGIAIVLVFIGLKMLVEYFHIKIPVYISLLVILVCIAASIVYSITAAGRGEKITTHNHNKDIDLH